MQRKTQRPVQFELTEPTRDAVALWIAKANLSSGQLLFPSRQKESPHITTRQYAGIAHRRVHSVGLDTSDYGTHTMRRTKAAFGIISAKPLWFDPYGIRPVAAGTCAPMLRFHRGSSDIQYP